MYTFKRRDFIGIYPYFIAPPFGINFKYFIVRRHSCYLLTHLNNRVLRATIRRRHFNAIFLFYSLVKECSAMRGEEKENTFFPPSSFLMYIIVFVVFNSIIFKSLRAILTKQIYRAASSTRTIYLYGFFVQFL